jgi:uncharacterized protein
MYDRPVIDAHTHPMLYPNARSAASRTRPGTTGGGWPARRSPEQQHFDVADPAVADVVRAAAAARLPILSDAYSPWDADQPGKFVDLARAVPEARLILARAHGPSFPQLVVYDFLARYPWWRKVGIDRVGYGSDYPLDDPVEALAAVGSLGFSDAGLAAVRHDNAAALLDA